MNEKMDGKFPMKGVGRIRRLPTDPYVIRFGDQPKDVDELRTYMICSELRPLLTPLAPLAAPEALWILNFFGGYGNRDKDLLNLLMELSCASGSPEPCPEPPSSG